MKDIFLHQINNQSYWFKIVLYTADGRVHQINPAAVRALVIEDTLYNFYQKGHIVIDNSFDVLERPANPDGDVNNTFLFMGDSRDNILIDIAPLNSGGSPVGGTIDDNAARFLQINLQAVIYDSEEISSGKPDEKLRKLYFWDMYYEYLREKNVYWSTADVVRTNITQNAFSQQTEGDNLMVPYADITSNTEGIAAVNNLNNEDRGIPTGQAIKEFLAAALPIEDQYPARFPGRNYENDPTNTINTPEIFDGDVNWDLGSTNIFFSTPATFKAIDTLQYLLDRHVSDATTEFDQCVLRIDRCTRCFTLTPMRQLFERAIGFADSGGDLYCETITLGGLVDAKSEQQQEFAPKNNVFKLTQTGSVKSFVHEPAVGSLTQKHFNTKSVHSYNSSDKAFQIDNARNNIRNTAITFHKNYVSPILPNGYVSVVPGSYRTENKNVEHVYSIVERDSTQRLAAGRNRALYAALYANNQISFIAPGATLRQAGMFIGVDREGSSKNSVFDNKFLGVYLITEVKHLFQGNEYTNEIKCIKTYTEKELYEGQISTNYSQIGNQPLI